MACAVWRDSAASVARLTLTEFRCYAHARIEAGPGIVVLTGPNGAGKTNLLEAISLLSPGRGLRVPRVRGCEIGRSGEARPTAIAEPRLRIGIAGRGGALEPPAGRGRVG